MSCRFCETSSWQVFFKVNPAEMFVCFPNAIKHKLTWWHNFSQEDLPKKTLASRMNSVSSLKFENIEHVVIFYKAENLRNHFILQVCIHHGICRLHADLIKSKLDIFVFIYQFQQIITFSFNLSLFFSSSCIVLISINGWVNSG